MKTPFKSTLSVAKEHRPTSGRQRSPSLKMPDGEKDRGRPHSGRSTTSTASRGDSVSATRRKKKTLQHQPDSARSDCESVASARSGKSGRSAASRRSSIESSKSKHNQRRRSSVASSVGMPETQNKSEKQGRKKSGKRKDSSGSALSTEALLKHTNTVQGVEKINLLMPSITAEDGDTTHTTTARGRRASFLRPSSAVASSGSESDSGSSRSSVASSRPKSSTRRKKSLTRRKSLLKVKRGPPE